MILNLYDERQTPIANLYGKAKGINLMRKYIPELNPFKQANLIDSVEDWEKIKENYPDIITCRADNKIGSNRVDVRGQTFHKENIPTYVEKVKQADEEGKVLCLETEEGANERIYTDGGFNILIEPLHQVIIEWVGKGFDSRELTEHKAAHESWSIPWEEILFAKPNRMKEYKRGQIEQSAYEKTAEERESFLIESAKEFSENSSYTKEKIRQYMPRQYQTIPVSIMEKLLDQIIFPIYTQSEEIRRSGMIRFGVQGNVVQQKLIPFEIALPERMIKKEEKGAER